MDSSSRMTVKLFVSQPLYDACLAWGLDVSGLVIDHPLPTSAEMRAEVKRKVDAGERLGASHNWRPYPGAQAAAMAGITEYTAYYSGGSLPGKTNKNCSYGTACMSALGGKCVACDNIE